jgi:hypothetical protein
MWMLTSSVLPSVNTVVEDSEMPDKRTRDTLRRFLAAMELHKIPFAVGGGIALNAHGVRRETTDVDAFLRDKDRARVRKAMLGAGFRIGRIHPPFHYIAMLPSVRDPDIRVDLMYPATEPELSAIANPVELEVWGECVPVFPVELLVIAKLQAVADAPGRATQDSADIEALYNNGAFEPATVQYLLDSHAPELIPVFRKIIRRPVGSRTRRRK